ncbi:MAG: hypothetical protein ACE5HL_11650 [Terriglobia bacterium]
MRQRYIRRTLLGPAVLLVLFSLSGALEGKEPKRKPEELIARHLAAIGAAEVRAATTSRIVHGQVHLSIQRGLGGHLEGPAIFLSEGWKHCLFLRFGHPEYESERFAFDGDTPYVARSHPGDRSALGEFFYVHDQLLREGLLGGVLSTAWALLDIERRQPKLKYDGLKKVEGRKLHQLRYRLKKGARDVRINLYFEPETFRHVLTVYRVYLRPKIATSPYLTARRQPTRFKLEETFSNFGQIDGLILPARWHIRFTIDAQTTQVWEWEMDFQQIAHNQEIDPNYFAMRD